MINHINDGMTDEEVEQMITLSQKKVVFKRNELLAKFRKNKQSKTDTNKTGKKVLKLQKKMKESKLQQE